VREVNEKKKKKKKQRLKSKRKLFLLMLFGERERENIPSTCLVCKRKKKKYLTLWIYLTIFNLFFGLVCKERERE
jgi:hypothetical protein